MSTQVAIAVPGKGFEIVPDEQTQRKFPAILTFDEHGDRLFGNSASSLVCFYRIAAIALFFSDDTSMLFSHADSLPTFFLIRVRVGRYLPPCSQDN